MLVVGLVCRNAPGLRPFAAALNPAWTSRLRRAAFTTILLQGGLSLDIQLPEEDENSWNGLVKAFYRILRSLAAVVLRLAFLPCIVEAAAVALGSWLFLGLPPLYGFILGFPFLCISVSKAIDTRHRFVLGAVSPAVCVPCMLDLESRGLGKDSGPSLLKGFSKRKLEWVLRYWLAGDRGLLHGRRPRHHRRLRPPLHRLRQGFAKPRPMRHRIQ